MQQQRFYPEPNENKSQLSAAMFQLERQFAIMIEQQRQMNESLRDIVRLMEARHDDRERPV